MNQAQVSEQVKENLRNKIERLERELEDERRMGFELFVEEEVSRLCDKAYLSVEL